MQIGALLFLSATVVVATACTPSERESSRSAVGSNQNAVENSLTVGKTDYLSRESIEIGCLIAANYITAKFDQGEKPLELLDTESFDDPDWQEDNAARMFAYLIGGENGDPDDSAIRERASAFASLAKKSLFQQCPAIGPIKVKRSFTPDPTQEVRPVTTDGLFYTYDTLVLMMPLVDLDRGQAFMWTATGCGPLCGGSGVEIFTRQPDGSWSRTDYLGLTIS